MKAQSNHHPGNITKGKDKSFVNYNIREVEITDETGDGKTETRTVYEYDYVEIKGEVTKAKFIKAIEDEEMNKKDVTEWIPDDVVLEHKSKEKI